MVFLIAVINTQEPIVLIKNIPDSDLNQRLIFSVWFEGRMIYSNTDQESRDLSQKKINTIKIFGFTDNLSLVRKTYQAHNHLHFNIPLICYKFSVCQHTSDG